MCMATGKVTAAYRKIKETFREKRKACMNIKSSDGKPLLGREEKAERWKEHIEGFYKGKKLDEHVLEREEEVDEDVMEDPILRSQFDRSLKDLSRSKAWYSRYSCRTIGCSGRSSHDKTVLSRR